MVDKTFEHTYMKLVLTKSEFHPIKVIRNACEKRNMSIDQFAELTHLETDTIFALLLGENDYTQNVIDNFQSYLGDVQINGTTYTWAEVKKKHNSYVAEIGNKLKGSPYEKYVPVSNNEDWIMKNEPNRYFGTVFNPLNKPVAELPIIFGFNNGGRPNFYEGILVSQDGVHLGGHVSSPEAWLRIDLGVVESPSTINSYEIKHKRFREHYPNGYIMEFVSRDDVSTHNQLRRAMQLLTEKSNNYEGPIMKNDINDTTTEVKIKQLPHAEGLPLPEYKTFGSVGFDFQAAIAVDYPILIAPGERVSIPTGLAVAIPEGLELQVRPRSGLAMNNGIMVVNTPGTVDQDYRGELIIILLNTDRNNTFMITRGDRIAQGVVSPIERVRFKQVNELPPTVRGEGGFGSTGI